MCGQWGSWRCPVHRMRKLLRTKRVGGCLWSFSQSKMLAGLRRLLNLLAVPSASEYTLKTFRAGRATQMAASGSSLGDILIAGEWRSSALARYVDDDHVDAAAVLRTTIDASDDEA